MFKNYLIAIVSVALVIFAILFFTQKPEKVYVRDLRIDTAYLVQHYEPDTIIKKQTRIVYLDTFAQNLPEIDTIYKDCKFVVNLFDKNIVSPVEMLAEDIQRWYLLTKPFEASDTIITKKNDTIMTRFDLSIQRPGQMNHFISYSPDSVMTIKNTIEKIPQKKWYESQWLSAAGGAIAAILIFLSVK